MYANEDELHHQTSRTFLPIRIFAPSFWLYRGSTSFRLGPGFLTSISLLSVLSLPANTRLAIVVLFPTHPFLVARNWPFTTLLITLTLQATRHEKMVLPMLLPPLNRPQSQNSQRPVMHDGNPRPKELAVPIAWLDEVGTPHILISMAHLMQERTDHTLKGVLRPPRPSFSEDHARIQLDPTLSFFAAGFTMAYTPRST